MGGTVGEVHGAKILGLLKKAIKDKVSAVYFIIDTGGVRLHEANAGLIAISEIMRAIFEVRSHNIPVYAIVGSQNGCFGGMGIVAGCCNTIVMNEEGRLGLSGPEVIETVHGVEEFDSKDKPLVWRTLGGKHRFIMGLVEYIVSDTKEDFRKVAIELVNLNRSAEINLDDMLKQIIIKAKLMRIPYHDIIMMSAKNPYDIQNLDVYIQNLSEKKRLIQKGQIKKESLKLSKEKKVCLPQTWPEYSNQYVELSLLQLREMDKEL